MSFKQRKNFVEDKTIDGNELCDVHEIIKNMLVESPENELFANELPSNPPNTIVPALLGECLNHQETDIYHDIVCTDEKEVDIAEQNVVVVEEACELDVDMQEAHQEEVPEQEVVIVDKVEELVDLNVTETEKDVIVDKVEELVDVNATETEKDVIVEKEIVEDTENVVAEKIIENEIVQETQDVFMEEIVEKELVEESKESIIEQQTKEEIVDNNFAKEFVEKNLLEEPKKIALFGEKSEEMESEVISTKRKLDNFHEPEYDEDKRMKKKYKKLKTRFNMMSERMAVVENYNKELERKLELLNEKFIVLNNNFTEKTRQDERFGMIGNAVESLLDKFKQPQKTMLKNDTMGYPFEETANIPLL